MMNIRVAKTLSKGNNKKWKSYIIIKTIYVDNLQSKYAFYTGVFSKRFSTAAKSFGSVDGAFEKDRIVKGPGDANNRDFTYFVLSGTRLIYASAVRLALIKVSLDFVTTR